MNYPKTFVNLINLLTKLPQIRPKMAERIAHYIIKSKDEEVENLIQTIKDAKEKVKECEICFNLTEDRICKICSDESRNKKMICVVEKVENLMVIERTKKYNGVYHVLGGCISPLEGKKPSDLKIDSLLKRSNGVDEIIIATSLDSDGELTANYLVKILKDKVKKITRIAYGLPFGSSLEYADDISLAHSFEFRFEVK